MGMADGNDRGRFIKFRTLVAEWCKMGLPEIDLKRLCGAKRDGLVRSLLYHPEPAGG